MNETAYCSKKRANVVTNVLIIIVCFQQYGPIVAFVVKI